MVPCVEDGYSAKPQQAVASGASRRTSEGMLSWLSQPPLFPCSSGAVSKHTVRNGKPEAALSAAGMREEQASPTKAVHPPTGQSVSVGCPEKARTVEGLEAGNASACSM